MIRHDAEGKQMITLPMKCVDLPHNNLSNGFILQPLRAVGATVQPCIETTKVLLGQLINSPMVCWARKLLFQLALFSFAFMKKLLHDVKGE